MKHFMTCKFYKRNDMNSDDIYSNDIEKQLKIGEEAAFRKDIREIKKKEDGQASLLLPLLQDIFVLSGINMMMMMTRFCYCTLP